MATGEEASMKNIWFIFKRELAGYFITPIAYVFIIIFLLLSGLFTFKVGHFYERGQADLMPFFAFHPWLYLFLIPAISMRLWSEERRTGTIELIMTLPVSNWEAVLGKYFAAWAFTGAALVLTFPLWITVSYLGSPDNGVIVASYLASFLMAGSYLAIGACISALTKNQVISFILTVVVCFLFVVSSLPMVTDFFQSWAPQYLVDSINFFSFQNRFDDLTRGVIALRNIVFFASMIACWLIVNAIVIDATKSE
jgi:ABC-2 type transport system permease protein